MVSEEETLVSICANLQFKEVRELEQFQSEMSGSLRSAQRNQKENLGHCWHFQDYINSCVASPTLYSLYRVAIFVCNCNAASIVTIHYESAWGFTMFHLCLG